MTVAELIEKLREMPQDAEIVGGMRRIASHTWTPLDGRAVCARCGLDETGAAESIFRCGGTVAKPDPDPS